jgi:hypothetical protein
MTAYQDAQQLTAEEYAEQQAIYGPMTAQFQSIFALGPNQEGFNPAEKQTLDTQAITGTAQNYQQVQRAMNEGEAAEGGGNAYAPSGAAQQIKEEVGTSAESQESQEETQITEADFAQGRQNWEEAAGGLESIAAGENPLGYEQAETSSGSAAGTTANQIAQEQNSWINAALGAAGQLGGAVIGEDPGGVFG